MDAAELTRLLKLEAQRLGFDLVGACPAATPSGVAALAQWLQAGYAGEMSYLASRLEAYRHPRHVLDGCRSLLMLGLNYQTAAPTRAAGRSGSLPGQGRVASYAWSTDYHDLIRQRLVPLVDVILRHRPAALARGVVDTAPLLEREFAQLAGLGWIGKNTLLLNRSLGSWFFLAAVLTDVELDYDPPQATDHCGTCRACLDACPTNAFVEPYVLDSRKCISYSTIEHRSSIPADLRAGHGDWLFGCDICQEVCPWNHRAPLQDDPQLAPQAAMSPIDLIELFDLDDAAFRQRFRHTPLWRPRRRGILRNAAIVLGNQRCMAARDALARGLSDTEPLVRAACAWAFGQLSDAESRQILDSRAAVEDDLEVRAEIAASLAQ